MLTGIDTGYEGKFDFPQRRDPPARPYLLASVPRTGSTLLSHLLWRTGCLGAPLEYLNFVPEGPYGFASRSPEAQQRLWASLVRRRTSPNGVFGVKAFPSQLEELRTTNPELLDETIRTLLPAGTRKRVVELRRRDRAAHAISYARASLSGIWRKEQEGTRAGAEPEYSAQAVANAEKLIGQLEGAWLAMYRDLGIDPLVVWYEDAVTDPAAVVQAVADYLEVQLDPAAAIEVPEVERQHQAGARHWAERHKQGG
jgi:LPS sulfotransferase NodH